MSKVFSWKINNDEYAYLFIPNKKNHLSSRITDSDIISNMIDKISLWDEKKYKNIFNQMNEEIALKYGFEIPYDESYFNGPDGSKNVILLGNSNDKTDKIDAVKSELLKEIDGRFEVMLKEFNDLYNELLTKTNNQMIDSVNLSKQTTEEALTKINEFKSDITKKFNRSIDKLDKASKVLELDDNNINADSLKGLFRMAHKTNDWVESVSNDIKTISREYKDLEDNLTIEEKDHGVFKTLKNKLDKTNLLLDNEKNEINNLKTHVRCLENEQINLKNIKLKERTDIVLGASKDISNIKRGNFSIDVSENDVVIENKETNSKIIIDNDGIKLLGNIFINGVRI